MPNECGHMKIMDNGLLGNKYPIHPMSPNHQRTLLAALILSRMHFTHDIKVHTISSCVNVVKLTKIGCYGIERPSSLSISALLFPVGINFSYL
jgi:hypothetical protein